MNKTLPNPKKIVLIFLLVGCAWIFLSGKFLFSSISREDYLYWEFIKGILFVLITAAFLYYFLVHYRKRLKKTLIQWQQREDQFRRFYEESPQPTWISSKKRGVLFMNQAALDLFGYSPEQIGDTLPEELVNLEENRYSGKVSEWDTSENKRGIRNFYTKFGQLLYLNLISQKIDYQGFPANLIIANNVTELIQAEKDKQRINNELFHYKKALDRSALLSVTDLNGVILDVNSKFCEISRFASDELIGKKHSLINSGTHPSSYFESLYKTVRQGKVWRGEVCNKTKDGKLFWVDMSVVPVVDQFNATDRYMAIAYPVTDRKAAELKSEKVQQELMTFMYKASHNLRGPVATLSGLLNIARIEVKEHNALNYINMMNERTKHLEYTLGELIDITKVKQEDLTISVISFDRLVKKVLGQFRKEIERHHFVVQTHFQLQNKCQFRSDPKLISNLLHYLIDNSIKFRSNKNPALDLMVREQAGGVLITVSDNGPGIDEELRSRIFEMYFRGSERSTGSGLGLYIVSSIVERLKGYINLQSKPGSGTVFTIFIPDSEQLEKTMENENHIYLPNRSMRII